MQPEIEIIETIQEAFSAKAPGRPLFCAMIERIELGEAEGIIAWAPDRLARNSIDGGRIIYFLDQGVLRDLKFASYTFENNSQGKFMLQIMFGQSKYYSDALSDNVKRGNRAKLANGWRPNRAPFGYFNERATKTIVRDPLNFPLVRRMFELILSGVYSTRQVLAVAQNEWGLRTPKRKRSGGRPPCAATVHRILTNPFYAGTIVWDGLAYPGKHEPVVSLIEFEEVQRRLRRPGQSRKQRHAFAYTGMIRCGSCGAMVTAERKVNSYGRAYLYYHCTKRLIDTECRERSVEVNRLEEQIVAFLRSIVVPAFVEQWVLDLFSVDEAMGKEDEEARKLSLEAAIAATNAELGELTKLRLRTLITDDEFVSDRRRIEQERQLLTDQLAAVSRARDRFEPFQVLVSFSRQAVDWFQHGDDTVRKLILETVGSNFRLREKILLIDAAKPFLLSSIFDACCVPSAEVDDVRTLLETPELNRSEIASALQATFDEPGLDRILANIGFLQQRCSDQGTDLSRRKAA
jgi:DNA invertase Pin-like site-specific DNA recombinase